MRSKCECPKEVRKAVRAFARAVKLVADLADLPCPDPQTEYHAKEYLDEMETLLLQQLATMTTDDSEREEVLAISGLDYLSVRLGHMVEELEGE